MFALIPFTPKNDFKSDQKIKDSSSTGNIISYLYQNEDQNEIKIKSLSNEDKKFIITNSSFSIGIMKYKCEKITL